MYDKYSNLVCVDNLRYLRKLWNILGITFRVLASSIVRDR